MIYLNFDLYLISESTIKALLKTDGKIYNSTVLIEHCPSNSGCRALLKQTDGNIHYPINDNFTITFNVCDFFSYFLELYYHRYILLTTISVNVNISSMQ